jgi:hypothetical protein
MGEGKEIEVDELTDICFGHLVFFFGQDLKNCHGKISFVMTK